MTARRCWDEEEQRISCQAELRKRGCNERSDEVEEKDAVNGDGGAVPYGGSSIRLKDRGVSLAWENRREGAGTLPQGPSVRFQRPLLLNYTACDLGHLLRLKTSGHFQDVGLIRAPPCSTIAVIQPESRPLQFANLADTPDIFFSDPLLPVVPRSLYPPEASLTSLSRMCSHKRCTLWSYALKMLP